MQARTAWFVVLAAAAVALVAYGYYKDADVAARRAPNLSSQSFKILDSTIQIRPAEETIRIGEVGE